MKIYKELNLDDNLPHPDTGMYVAHSWPYYRKILHSYPSEEKIYIQPITLSELLDSMGVMGQIDGIIEKELNNVFEMGLKQSPFDAENSEFYRPMIELTITPRLRESIFALLRGEK